MIWIFFLYVIPAIIGILLITCWYKIDCKRRVEKATIEGLLIYDYGVIILTIMPVANIIFALVVMFLLLVESIKDIKI